MATIAQPPVGQPMAQTVTAGQPMFVAPQNAAPMPASMDAAAQPGSMMYAQMAGGNMIIVSRIIA